MKNTNTKNNRRRFTAGILAALAAASVLAVPSSAFDEKASQSLIPQTAVAAASSATAQKSARYYKQMERFKKMQEREISITAWNLGGYIVKSSKIYGKKVIGVNDNGDFIYGNWERLTDQSNIWYSKSPFKSFKVSGAYVKFAYSFDIVGGTDYPFSRVFWNEPEKDMDKIEITLSGSCRSADIHIVYEYFHADDPIHSLRIGSVIETDCNSHKEWTP